MSDTPTYSVKPYSPDAAHTRLLALVGSWRGPTRTFMDPATGTDESVWSVNAAPVFDGRFVELTYSATILNGTHAGRLLLAHHNGAFSAVWIDSFHTGTDAIVFTELPGHADAIALDGGYTWEGTRHGWRIFIRQPDADRIDIDHVNIMTGIGEFPAIETRLRREPG